MTDFLRMGGYAVYVWSSYALVAVVLAGLTVWTVAALARASRTLTDLEALAPRRRRRSSPETIAPETVIPETITKEAPHA